MKALSDLVLRHTVVSRRHLTPEIALRLITPSCGLWREQSQHPFPMDPFWAFYWPGGQALTRYILDGAPYIENKRILDVGSGCGACSIAAVKIGAKYTLANDIDLCSIAAIRLNAELNDVALVTSKEDFIASKCDDFDTILIGDMFYDEEFARILFKWLEQLVRADKTVLIGDPGRHGLTDKRRNKLKLLAKYTLTEDSLLENNGFPDACVWKLDYSHI